MFKGRHFDRSVILLCVRWYLAYNLSLRDLEEMMAERGLSVDHSTVHRWVVHFSPQLLQRFHHRKRAVTGKWHVHETYIKVRGQRMYLYRAIDSRGDTVEFHFMSTATWQRRSASSGKPCSVMAALIGLSSTAARRTGKPSCPATRQSGCRTSRGAGRSRCASARAAI